MPCHRFRARPGETPPRTDDRRGHHHDGEREDTRGDQATDSAREPHEPITGTPVAFPTNTSSWAGSVVNSPSRMVLLLP